MSAFNVFWPVLTRKEFPSVWGCLVVKARDKVGQADATHLVREEQEDCITQSGCSNNYDLYAH